MIKHPEEPLFYVISSDANTLAPGTKQKLLSGAQNGDAQELPPSEFGYPRGEGHWASCIEVVDPQGKEVTHKIELEENEAALSVAVVPFSSQDDTYFLVVGTAKDLVVNPRGFSCGYIHVYSFNEEGKELEFIHKVCI